MKWPLKGLIFSALMLTALQSAFAHEVRKINGTNGVNLGVVPHQHYRSGIKYGGTYRTGHGAEAGDSGIIIWSAKAYNGYGLSQTRNRHYRGGFKGQSPYGQSNNKNYGKDTRRKD